MRINSIAKSNQYNTYRELSYKHENKRRRKDNEQDILFSDVLEQMKKNSADRNRK
ncbi:hypothetical protein [Clostridium sp. DJ247]|uniref:hypothetical protein n=1 Tax=Clostridium sp. DJ247 TaxID=2726188 RepID=UPI001627A9B6|nr:hypothetical protein [Clostridium sp. DJ247]MBC2581302.1 hypothetical protein [Clostridium sp. DJ247]